MKETYHSAGALKKSGIVLALIGVAASAAYLLFSTPRFTALFTSGYSSIAQADEAMCHNTAQDKKDVLFIGCGGFF